MNLGITPFSNTVREIIKRIAPCIFFLLVKCSRISEIPTAQSSRSLSSFFWDSQAFTAGNTGYPLLALLYLLALNCQYPYPDHHQPGGNTAPAMYHFLGILAVVDMGMPTNIMPKILAILWFNAKSISLPECFLQMYAIHTFMLMESGIFVCMAIDRYVAICRQLHYPSIINKCFCGQTLYS